VNLNLDANTLGGRIVMALAVMALCAEMLSDNSCHPATPIEPAACEAMCERQGAAVKRWESYACECVGEGCP
jgi:hypothetical protein